MKTISSTIKLCCKILNRDNRLITNGLFNRMYANSLQKKSISGLIDGSFYNDVALQSGIANETFDISLALRKEIDETSDTNVNKRKVSLFKSKLIKVNDSLKKIEKRTKTKTIFEKDLHDTIESFLSKSEFKNPSEKIIHLKKIAYLHFVNSGEYASNTFIPSLPIIIEDLIRDGLLDGKYNMHIHDIIWSMFKLRVKFHDNEAFCNQLLQLFESNLSDLNYKELNICIMSLSYMEVKLSQLPADKIISALEKVYRDSDEGRGVEGFSTRFAIKGLSTMGFQWKDFPVPLQEMMQISILPHINHMDPYPNHTVLTSIIFIFRFTCG